MKKTLNTLNVSQLQNALNGKTERTEEYTSKLNNKLIKYYMKVTHCVAFFIILLSLFLPYDFSTRFSKAKV